MRRIDARRTSIVPFLPLLLMIPMLVPGDSGAYTPSVLSSGVATTWDLRSFAANVQNDRVSWHSHPAGTKDEVDNIWGIDEFEAIRRSFAAWENVETSRLRFWEDTIRTAQRHNVQDRVNLIQWLSEELDPFILGVTFPYEEGGHLVDCDIVLNEEFNWSTTTPGRSNRPDVQSVVTHEIGHFLGLDHSPLGQSTMYYSYAPGAISTRTLEEDDVAGITTLYPTDDVDLVYGRIVGRVDVAGTTNERGIQVVALDIATSQAISSALSLPDGSYEILVKPGFYRLLATPARPSASLNPFWASGDDKVLPAPLTSSGAAIGASVVVRVDAGATATVGDIHLERVSSPLEPDDSSSKATTIHIGDIVAARFEASKNDDWFAFDGNAGDILTISVHASQIGSSGDPELTLYDTNASTVLRRSLDIRTSLYEENRNGIAGVDVDSLIESVSLPRSGRFYLKVRPSGSSDTGGKGDYYVLGLASSKDAPAPMTTEVSVSPPRMKADGASTALVTVIPRNSLDEQIGAGLFVDIGHDGLGDLGPVTDMGDGRYTATLTAATTPGADFLDVQVRGGGGNLDLQNVLEVVYVGPPYGPTSDVTASPRRIPADGKSTTTLRVTPRDARGEVVGSDVAVVLEYVGATAGILGPVTAHRDGSYTATLWAPTGPTDVLIRAVMNGTTVTAPTRVSFGYEIESVTRSALADLHAASTDEETTASVRKQIDKALVRLRRVDGYLGDPRLLVPDFSRASKDLKKAFRYLAKARAKADDAALLPVTEELLEAFRRVVDAEAAPSGPARDRYALALVASAAGDVAGAAKNYDKAFQAAVAERDPSHVRAAEVVLERDGASVALVVRMMSGKVKSARLVGPVDISLKSTGTVDGSRVYAADAEGVLSGAFDLRVEPKGDGAASQSPFTVNGNVPVATVILSPTSEASDVSTRPVIRWTAVAGATEYGIVVTDARGRLVFADRVLAGGGTESTVPAALALGANARHTVEIIVRGEGGNRSVARSSFRTGP